MTHSIERHQLRFPSGDSDCDAALVRPIGVERPPVVVLGHGLGATREMGLDAYADRFAAARAIGVAGSLRLMPPVARDLLARARGRRPARIPLIGAPGTPALMSTPDSEPGYRALIPDGLRFVNGVAARVVPAITAYRPGRAAARVTTPILFCVCNHDSVAPADTTLAHARRAPRGEIRTYPAAHFDIYRGAPFEAVVADQVAFLARHLDVDRA